MQPFSIEKTATLKDVAERILMSHLGLSASEINDDEIRAQIKSIEDIPNYIASFGLFYGEGLLGDVLITKDGDRSKITFTPNPKYPATT